MKPSNFPARKLARQIGAAVRKGGDFPGNYAQQLDAARQVRTKKRRSSV